MEEPKKIPIKTYTKSEIAGFYDIHINTLRNWLIKANIYTLLKTSKILSINEVKLIFEKLGWPEKEGV